MSLEMLLGADFKTVPYKHQIQELEEHAEAPARALAWTMRSGKSKLIIDRACHLYRADKIDAVLIFAPNGVHRNWIENEIPAHTWPGIRSTGLAWQTSIAGAKAINQLPQHEHAAWFSRRAEWWKWIANVRNDKRLLWLAFNSESMTRADTRKAVARFIKHRRVFVVFDESDDFGTPGTKRTKMARAIALRCPFRAILSGTIVTGSPLHAFSQYELLQKAALGFERYADFKNRYAIYVPDYGRGRRKFPKLAGYQNEEELRERMSRFTSVVLREDCDDMPDLVCSVRKIMPTKEQLAVYRELHQSFVLDIDNRRVSVGERAPRFQKMQQVFSGFVINDRGEVQNISGGNPRLDAVADEVSRAPGKVIIWCNFQRDIDLVVARLLAEDHKIVEYHGRVADKGKVQALKSFREAKEVRALVGHPQSGGRGIDMSVASKIIWYSHTFKARLRQQAMERATKIGGKNISVIDFEAPGPDVRILEVIRSRIDVANMIAGVGMRDFLKGLVL